MALKETVREKALQRAPQSLWDSLQRHLVGPLLALTAAGVPSVLLLDFPPNRGRAAVPYDRGAGAATLVQNAVIMQAVRQVRESGRWALERWTAPRVGWGISHRDGQRHVLVMAVMPQRFTLCRSVRTQ